MIIRSAAITLACVLVVASSAYAQSNGPRLRTDPRTGQQYYIEVIFHCSPDDTGQRRCGILKIPRYVNRKQVGGRSIGVVAPRPRTEGSVPPEVAKSEQAKTAIDAAKRDNPDEAVNELGADNYEFGSAGASAAASAFAYGIATRLVTDPGQQARIQRLKQEIGDLNAAIERQATQAAATEAQISNAVAERAATLSTALDAVKDLPVLNYDDPLLGVADGDVIYATEDPAFAAQLHQLRTRIIHGEFATQLTPELRNTGLASVRLADLEHAAGQTDVAEGFTRIAKAVADVAVGIDPITGTARGLYELVTGKNLITGEELSDLGRGLAALNVATVGLFATAPKAVQAIAKLGKLVSGGPFRRVTAALGSLGRRFPSTRITAALNLSRTAGFTAAETSIIVEAKGILRSAELAELQAAAARGESLTVNVLGRKVMYEPNLAASGMTMFGDNGFVLGRDAFKSTEELSKTVLHELHRLGTSVIPQTGATAGIAAAETQRAFDFAERAYQPLAELP